MTDELIEQYMQIALEEARVAALVDEVPVGALIVRNGEIIARANNHKERANCAVRHAEIEALEMATRIVGNWYLDDCEMIVTLEPCVMCAGAIMLSRIKAVYFGAFDPKSGGFGGLYDLAEDKKLNHRLIVKGGYLEKECGKILSDFFKNKRINKK